MKRILAVIFGLAALALAHAGFAQQKAPNGPLETRLEARKVTRGADGSERFEAADAARPGDVIEYVATYRNTGKASIKGLEATLPIPANTELIPTSLRPASARASLDGTEFSVPPLKRSVKRNGVDVQEQVPVREYRFLRWYPGALDGERAVQFIARVRVVDDRTPSEPGSKGGGK